MRSFFLSNIPDISKSTTDPLIKAICVIKYCQLIVNFNCCTKQPYCKIIYFGLMNIFNIPYAKFQDKIHHCFHYFFDLRKFAKHKNFMHTQMNKFTVNCLELHHLIISYHYVYTHCYLVSKTSY